MPSEPPRFDPERILEVLERHRVDYVMVEGFASQLHGARRHTYDIDFVPATTEANDDRLASALRELGARLRVAGLTDEEARQLPVTGVDTNPIEPPHLHQQRLVHAGKASCSPWSTATR